MVAKAALMVNPEAMLDSDVAAPAGSAKTTLRIAACAALSYFLVYFIRYPVFMLPDEVALRPFATIFGKEVTLQEALTLAFCMGLGLAKLPAVRVMSSGVFFRNRFAFMVGLNVLACAALGLPLALTKGEPVATFVGVFISCFPQSWVYCGVVTYLEGRRCTEMLFAALTFCFIFGGSASRGAATAVLSAGMPPHLMPLAICGALLPPLIFLFWVLDRSPPPSAEDVAMRRPRRAMTAQERQAFLRSYWPGIVLLVCGYILLSALRNARDLFNRDLITAANGGSAPSPLVFTFIDMPGAVIAAVAQMAFVRVRENRRALVGMVLAIVLFLLAMIAATAAFRAGFLGGITWQVILGVGMFGSFSMMSGSPVYDRLVSSSDCTGATCTFLIFMSDGMGYLSTMCLVLWKTFMPGGQSPGLLLNEFLQVLLPLTAAMVACYVAVVFYFLRRFWASVPEPRQTFLADECH